MGRAPPSRSGALPTAVVIGGAKCGTSALHYYLDLHPEVSASHPKELNFFIEEQNWPRGVGWYRSHFRPEATVRVESSTGYTAPWFEGVAERMASVVPDAKLIFLVRDPIDRMISHYLHYRLAGTELRPLSEALADYESRYVVRSRYHAQLEPFLERFPAGNLYVAAQEDLLHERRETMGGVYRFLGVDDSFWSPKMERLRNVTAGKGRGFGLAERLRRLPGSGLAYRLPEEVKWLVERRLYSAGAREPPTPQLEEGLRTELVEHLADDVANLRRVAGRDFPRWSM
jgi:hypothetical protein